MATNPRFSLDRFQLQAIAALELGRSVLVAAPTGAGKTVVAEAAIDLALGSGGKAFYTTPIKALSNQKFGDLRRRLGDDRVGLLTGDNSINADAPVVVMTTEVLRNMIYGGSDTLRHLRCVILDEVHYLQDAYRGPVWEEVIVHLPPDVRLVCLSATVSNSTELGEWIGTIRGATETIVEARRPVELKTLYLVGDRSSEGYHLVPLLEDDRPNPEGHRFTEDPRLARRSHGRVRRRFFPPRRVETVERLRDENLLPAIYFIFSRAGCDDALAACRDAGVRLTDASERPRIREIVEAHVEHLSDADLDTLNFDEWLTALEMGIGAHHAGMIPPFKEAVESCFIEGLIKVVFATETLALGINMPARSVVLEKLSKYNGEGHELLTPSEFTQLTGRAGRRGIDDVGYAIASWSPFVSFEQTAALAASRSFPLTSAFRPTYNMTANLVARFDRGHAVEVLGQSFAQFQADRALVGLGRRLAAQREHRRELSEAAACELGDPTSYAEAVHRAERARAKHPSATRSVDTAATNLRPGDVIDLPDDEGRAVVVSVASRGRGALRIRTVDGEGIVHRVEPPDFDVPPHPLATVELPAPYAPGELWFVEECSRLVRDAAVTPPASRQANAAPPWIAAQDAVETHPVHACPQRNRHVAAIRNLERLDRQIADLTRAVERRSGSVVRRFDRILDLLRSRNHLHDWSLTSSGRRLSSVYHESDLLVLEALESGILDGLEAPELAGVLSCLTYEERRSDAPALPASPSGRIADRVSRLCSLAREIQLDERRHGLPTTRTPDAGFVALAHAWAEGRDLEDVLDGGIPAGDFVRNVRLLVDLLRQVADLAPQRETGARAREAAGTLSRGVVEASAEIPPASDPGVAGVATQEAAT